LVGICVGIIHDHQVVYSQGFGNENLAEEIPATTDTMYRWASVSKPVTAVAAMQLVEQGKLKLDDDVRDYVPEFPEQGHTITVRDLMCHQSGIVHYSNGKVIRTKREYDVENPFESVILALDTFRESPLVHPPCEQYSYSTHAYILLSAVVERAGEEQFYEQVKQRICQPLDLDSLQPDYQWLEIPNRAVGYRLGRISGKHRRSSNTDVSWKLGGGGFISTIDDMAGFACGLMSDELLTNESLQQMWTAQSLSDGSDTNVGLGFFIGDQDGQLVVSHNGSQEKTRTRMMIYPESGRGIVIMTNSQHANPGQITNAIIQELNK
ncbi:MAG: serine hydrolase domain-containing protein, partial [Pirellulaceae bacterium]